MTAKDTMKDIVYIINNLFIGREVIYSYKYKQFTLYIPNKVDIILPKQTQYFIDYNILEAETGNFETGDISYILKDKKELIEWLKANSTSDSPHITTLNKNNFLNAIRSLKLQKLNI